MMRRLFLKTVIVLLVFIFSGSVQAQLDQRIYVDTVVGLVAYDGVQYLPAASEVIFRINIINTGVPACKYAPSMAFTVESTDGAVWSPPVLKELDLYVTEPFPGNFITKRFKHLFSEHFYESFSLDGIGSDTLGFAGVAFAKDSALFAGFNKRVWWLRFTPTETSAGKTICVNNGGQAHSGFEWAWNALDNQESQTQCDGIQVIPDWDGPYCYQVYDYQAICCGLYTEGMTGNTDCDTEGLRNLADITRLIDYVYLTHEILCCMYNGNIDGDAQAKVNLADITRLIDNIYISHSETANCQ